MNTLKDATQPGRPSVGGDWARLATYLRAARNALDLSQPALASKAGVSPRTVGDFERRTTAPSTWPRRIERIEAALGWLPGSIRRVLDGGEPILPGRVSLTAEHKAIFRVAIEQMDNVSRAAKNELLSALDRMYPGGR